MSEIKLKDFILNEIPEKGKTSKPAPKTQQPEYVFTLEYENDVDFILRRITTRTDKSLVCIVSQGQIYLKDNKTNDVELVSTKDQLIKFKSGMTCDQVPKTSKLTWIPFEVDSVWQNGRYQDCVKVSYDFGELIKHRNAYKVLANKKLDPFHDANLLHEYFHSPEKFDDTVRLINTVKEFYPKFNAGYSYFTSIMSNLRAINFHVNTISRYRNEFDELGEKFLYLAKRSEFPVLFNTYNIDFGTWLKWILYTVHNHNGIELSYYSNGFNLSDYIDYLRMQQEMYGKIKNKYPQYWLSEHQILVHKYNDWKTLRAKVGFELNQEPMKVYEYENEDYKVIIPLMSSDILDEAHQQQHCVASYIDRIARGDTHIVFIRKPDKPEESVLTVEINNKHEVCQVRGHMNRDYTFEEYKFMVEWAKETGLMLTIREKKDEEETEV